MAAPIPPISTPLTDDQNRVTEAWYRFFSDLRTRMGGDADLALSATNTAFTATVNGTDGTTRDGGLVLS